MLSATVASKGTGTGRRSLVHNFVESLRRLRPKVELDVPMDMVPGNSHGVFLLPLRSGLLACFAGCLRERRHQLARARTSVAEFRWTSEFRKLAVHEGHWEALVRGLVADQYDVVLQDSVLA